MYPVSTAPNILRVATVKQNGKPSYLYILFAKSSGELFIVFTVIVSPLYLILREIDNPFLLQISANSLASL